MKTSSNTTYQGYPNKLFTIIIIAASMISAALVCLGQPRAPWLAPKTAQVVQNPLAGNKSVLPDAKTLYTNNCAPCHGSKGRGDGPAATALTPKPADHSSSVVQSETDGSLFWKISEGRNPMPSYKKILTDNQRWGLINYIRTLAKPAK